MLWGYILISLFLLAYKEYLHDGGSKRESVSLYLIAVHLFRYGKYKYSISTIDFNHWSRMRWAEGGSIFFSLYLTPLEYKIRQNEVVEMKLWRI